MSRTSVGVSRCGDVRGQDDWSSSAHASCRCQAWNRLGESRENPQKRPQRDARAGPIDGAQDPALGASVGESLVGHGEPRDPQHRQREPKQGRELLDAPPEPEDLLPKFRVREGRHVKADDDLGRPAEPPTGR